MRSLNKWARTAVSACAVAVAGFASAPAQAEVIQLGFILDSSGSIGAANWNVIRQGLSDAIGLIPTSGSDSYEISVVTFSSTVNTIIDSVVVTAGNKATLQGQVSTMAFINTNTNFAAAFDRMTQLLTTGSGIDSRTAGQKSYVNFATDGQPNEGGDGRANATALVGSGVDNLSVEGLGSGVDAAELQAHFCNPTPCDTTNPYNFPAQGFYIAVATAADYAAAIQQKIRIVTNQVPEPASLALVGLALAAAGLSRRRRDSSAG